MQEDTYHPSEIWPMIVQFWWCPLTHLAFSVGPVPVLLSLIAGTLEFVIGWLNPGSFWCCFGWLSDFLCVNFVFSKFGCRVATPLNPFTGPLLEDFLLALSITYPGHWLLAVLPAHLNTCKGKCFVITQQSKVWAIK